MNLVVNDELANRMSLFYAQSTPLTKLLIDTAQGLVVCIPGVLSC